MMSGWQKRIASSAATSLLLVALAAGLAGAAPTVRLEGDALAAAESEARDAVAPLAEGTPRVDRSQVFAVTDAGAQFRIVPVRYAPRVPGELANVDSCALVIEQADRPASTVQTIGIGYTEAVGCGGLDGIGFPDLDGDGRFDIALIYSTIAPPDRLRKTPVVLRRNGDGPFTVDATLGAALDAKGGITTIAALRRAAADLLKGAQKSPR
jgi:hypothetical protein